MMNRIKDWIRGIVQEEYARLEMLRLVKEVKEEIKKPEFTDVDGGPKGEFIQVNKVAEFIKNNDNISIGDVIEPEY